MRKLTHILSLVFTVTLFVPSFAFGEGVKYEDLVKREGLYYKKFTEVPFTGKATNRFLDQLSFKDGKRDGFTIIYWSNGQIHLKGNYKDGKLHGPFFEYSENGKLVGKGTYKDGKRDGYWHYYKSDGSKDLFRSGTYKGFKKISD